MSICDLTIKDSRPKEFWTNSTKALSKKLWLPIERNFYNKLKYNDKDTWFSIKYLKNQEHTSLKETTEETVIRTKKIRIFPTKEQKQILRKWFGCATYTYNQTIDKIRKKEITPYKWKGVKAIVLNDLPHWAKETPYSIKGDTVREACTAVLNTYEKRKQTKKFHEASFRKKRSLKKSINIPPTSITPKGIYPKILGEMKFSEKFDKITKECKLVYEFPNQYFLATPYARVCIKENSENQTIENYVALDPGVRTFQTFYSPKSCGKIGNNEIKRIERLCGHLDNLYSKFSKTKEYQRKRRINKALARLRQRIRNLVDEVHWKTIRFLCSNFSTIFIPKFEVSDMVTNLNSKVSRAMLTWSHYRFRTRLENKSLESGIKIFIVNESYTTQTCTNCGNLNKKIGSNKIFQCQKCPLKGDRDILASRNIFLRTLCNSEMKPLLRE